MAIVMKADGIPGELTIAGFEGWMPLTTVEWTAQAQRVTDRDGVTVQGLPQLQDIVFGKVTDTSSTFLTEAMTRNREIPSIRISWLRTGDDGALPYYGFDLENCYVKSFKAASLGGGDSRPAEIWTIGYESVTVQVHNTGDDLAGSQLAVTFSVPGARSR